MNEHNDNRTDRLVRQHLDQQADRIDTDAFVGRVMLSCERTSRIKTRLMLIGAAAAIVAFIGYSVFTVAPPHAERQEAICQADDMIMNLIQTHGIQLITSIDEQILRAEKSIGETLQQESLLADALPFPDHDSFYRFRSDIREFAQDILRIIDQAIAGVHLTI